jgi:hypothetical protein
MYTKFFSNLVGGFPEGNWLPYRIIILFMGFESELEA